MDYGLPQSGILTIACALFAAIVVLAAPFARRISGNHAFWALFAACVWLYVFCCRQLLYLLPGTAPFSGGDSILVSRRFLLDLCPFYALIAPPLYLLKNKAPAMVLAPFGLFGAAVTLGGGAISNADAVPSADFARYVFLGTDGNQLYFMMHFLAMVLSLATLCWMRGWKARFYLYMNGFALLYYSYVLIVLALVPEADENAAGLLRIDWAPYGEYAGVADFLGMKAWPDDWPAVMVVGYVLSYLGISILFWVRYACARIWALIANRHDLGRYFARARDNARKTRDKIAKSARRVFK